VKSSQAFTARRALGLSFGEGPVRRGVHHLLSDVHVISRKLNLLSDFGVLTNCVLNQ